MYWFSVLSLLLVLFVGEANAQCVGVYPFQDNCPLPAAGLNAALTPVHVPDNAALQAASVATYVSVIRDDFSAGLGAPPLQYKGSNFACPLNAGAGDGGSQVQSVDGKCWLASLPLAHLDARWWGTTTNPVNLYSSPSGTDSGNFCINNLHPCTIQGAMNQALRFDANGGWIQINLGSNSYTSGVICNGAGGGVPPVYLVGPGSGSATIGDTTMSAAAVIATEYCELGLQGVKITSLHGGDVFPQHHARISFISDLDIGTAALGQLHAETGGIIEIPVSYKISGGAPAHLQSVLGGIIEYDETAITVTLTGTPAFSIGFADIEDTGSIAYVPNGFVSFSGSATGPRGLIKTNGTVETNSGTATFLPGNAPLQLATGGRYSPEPAPTLGTPTGIGSTGTVLLVSGSTDHAFTVQLSPGGTGITSVATIPFTFGASYPGIACGSANLITGTLAWNPQAVGAVPNFTNTGGTLQGSNNAVALTAGAGTYYLGAVCAN